ncbi:MAG: hypothetical protein AAF184_09605 [Pseudomonadota bacterium]
MISLSGINAKLFESLDPKLISTPILDSAGLQQALQTLGKGALNDLAFPDDLLERLQDSDDPTSNADNSDVWDAYVSQMANDPDETGASVRELDAALRELATDPARVDSAEVDALVANLADGLPVGDASAGQITSALGGGVLTNIKESIGNLQQMLEGRLETLGELSAEDVSGAVDELREAPSDEEAVVDAAPEQTYEVELVEDIEEVDALDATVIDAQPDAWFAPEDSDPPGDDGTDVRSDVLTD